MLGTESTHVQPRPQGAFSWLWSLMHVRRDAEDTENNHQDTQSLWT